MRVITRGVVVIAAILFLQEPGIAEIYAGVEDVSVDGKSGLCSNSPLMQISSLWAGGIGRHVTQ
jgi:hypothetical protein